MTISRGLLKGGAAVTGLGLSQLAQADKLGKVLAKNTPRKLAFLVGINNYPDDGALRGYVNDVQLIGNLLVHRFGFQPKLHYGR